MSRPRSLQFMGGEFVLALHAAAQRRGFTMADVSTQCHVSESTLSMMKRHGRVPDVCAAQSLASWAGLDLADYVKTKSQ